MAARLHSVLRLGSTVSSGVLFNIFRAEQLPFQTWHKSLHLVKPISSLFCTSADKSPFDNTERYKEKPWEYFESEEYTEKYGNRPIWADYRRNHKGGIPPQKTRKTCIRGNKISGNPCPVCRDPKIIVDYRNIKLLDQFISSHTGVVHDTTKTGLCRKQQKSLVKEIEKARGHGLIPYQVPFVEFRIENYTNLHSAVNKTPSAPGVNESTSWYFWYDWNEPPEKEIAKLHKIYHKYVKDTSN
ncbi:28S ribosomal protein S18b, mitochondrial isoform X1 [Erpetoichthys calabaricus]|uniref:Small ribosomal subunit protein mS40 n=1 Tax=Erpetoichthys calabaricus TaxID=27687 RepID=A0A8C4RTP6_ERPCA|nr:28S ribosomal protein S18b, mitochondrial isoform X1 [Erpetoichthys calabaricus]